MSSTGFAEFFDSDDDDADEEQFLRDVHSCDSSEHSRMFAEMEARESLEEIQWQDGLFEVERGTVLVRDMTRDELADVLEQLHLRRRIQMSMADDVLSEDRMYDRLDLLADRLGLQQTDEEVAHQEHFELLADRLLLQDDDISEVQSGADIQACAMSGDEYESMGIGAAGVEIGQMEDFGEQSGISHSEGNEPIDLSQIHEGLDRHIELHYRLCDDRIRAQFFLALQYPNLMPIVRIVESGDQRALFAYMNRFDERYDQDYFHLCICFELARQMGNSAATEWIEAEGQGEIPEFIHAMDWADALMRMAMAQTSQESIYSEDHE